MTAAPDLAADVAIFGGALRRGGIPVGLSDEIDAARALARLPGSDRRETRCLLQLSLKIRRQDWERFDALFERCWGWPSAPLERSARAPASTGRLAGPGGERGSLAIGGLGPPAGEARTGPPGYSPEALLRRKPFEACSGAEVAAMERLLARLGARLALRRSRRLVPTPGRGVPDFRRSLRRALATEGELLSVARRCRAIEEPRLVVFCDTSGSMDAHARFLLAFVLALRRAARSTEVFAFNTSLVRLTPWLSRRRLGPTLERLAAAVPDWSGGTRIGECLARFVEHHLEARVSSKTVVLVLSDGLDRGDTAALEGAMRAIRARARRVIWLNPLLGDPRYEPTARGMKAALPYIDELLPAHDFASLERLLPRLSA